MIIYVYCLQCLQRAVESAAGSWRIMGVQRTVTGDFVFLFMTTGWQAFSSDLFLTHSLSPKNCRDNQEVIRTPREHGANTGRWPFCGSGHNMGVMVDIFQELNLLKIIQVVTQWLWSKPDSNQSRKKHFFMILSKWSHRNTNTQHICQHNTYTNMKSKTTSQSPTCHK